MVDVTNLTKLQEANTMWGIFNAANYYSEGVMMGLLMITVFLVMLMALKRYPFEEVLLSSSFVCFVLSAILVYSELLSFYFPLIFLVIMAFSGLYVFITKRD